MFLAWVQKTWFLPRTNKNFWLNKINANINRDKIVTKHYKKNEWKIIRIWEHEINKNFEEAVKKCKLLIKSK